jgi:hypothetical protein
MIYALNGLCLVVFIFFLIRYKSRAYHKGPPSNHFDGRRFHNTVRSKPKTLWAVIKWRWTGDRPIRPAEIFPAAHLPVPSPTDKHMVITFVNHASCLIQTGQINILTDPHYSERASPVSWAGPQRLHEPGIAYDKLPHIDVVIISHDHYDHMDKRTLKMLHKDHNPLFLVGLGNDVHMKSFGISENVKTVDWWDPMELGNATFTFVPAQHFSGRGIYDRNATLWGGYVIQVDAAKLFFAGETWIYP